MSELGAGISMGTTKAFAKGLLRDRELFLRDGDSVKRIGIPAVAQALIAIALFALILLSNFAIPRNNSIDMESATEGIVNDREALEAPPALDTDKLIDSAN